LSLLGETLHPAPQGLPTLLRTWTNKDIQGQKEKKMDRNGQKNRINGQKRQEMNNRGENGYEKGQIREENGQNKMDK